MHTPMLAILTLGHDPCMSPSKPLAQCHSNATCAVREYTYFVAHLLGEVALNCGHFVHNNFGSLCTLASCVPRVGNCCQYIRTSVPNTCEVQQV